MVDAAAWPSGQTQPPRLLEMRRERRFHHKKELMLESVRRLTFSNWTVPYVDPDQLARSGFFYLRTLDHVECVFCNGIVGYWEKGDQPEVEHRKHFPQCPFVMGKETGNVPVTNQEDDTGRVFRLLDEYHTFRITSTRPMTKNKNFPYDASRNETGQLAFPEYSTPSSRQQTYKNWPKGFPIEPQALVEAGFYSIGVSDWVQCFHCGGGLFGWREGDNPTVDHLRYYPFCPFVRQKQIEDTSNQTWGDNVPPSAFIRPLELTECETELLLSHPVAQRIVGLGLSKESVKMSLKERLQACGVLSITVTEALEIVFDYDERQRRQGIQHDYVQTNSHIASSEKQNDSTVPATDQQVMPEAEGCEEKHQTLVREVDELRQSVDREENRLRCRECKTKKVEVVLQPCSHLHLCSSCARPRERCPTCGTFVRGTLRPILN